MASEETHQSEQVGSPGSVTRRSFIKSLAAAGAGAAFISNGAQLARADHKFTPKNLSDEQLIELHRKMVRIRWYDRTVIDKMLTEDGYRGYAHAYCGEEAVAVGACSTLEEGDWMQGYHRSHGHAIAQGADLKKMAAEIDFKQGGTNNGLGGSMHIMQRNVGMLGEDGIVGPGAAIGAGAAHGLKAQGSDRVALAFGGDGHAESPYFHIALNEAANLSLPFIYIIENNKYEISKHYTETVNVKDVANMAQAYNIPGFVIDGQDVLQVYDATREAVDRARNGKGPTLIEAKTYRYYNHFGAGGAKPGQLGAFGLAYRSDRELRHWMARDPIDQHRRTLVNWGVMTKEEVTQLEEETRQEVKDAFAWADQQPVPKAEKALDYVFVEGAPPARQLAETPLY